MKFIEDGPVPVVELTRRNLETLLAKLDDPASARTLRAPEGKVYVRAVENDAHVEDAAHYARVRVTAVENAAHYSDRPPGEIYMPTSGTYI